MKRMRFVFFVIIVLSMLLLCSCATNSRMQEGNLDQVSKNTEEMVADTEEVTPETKVVSTDTQVINNDEYNKKKPLSLVILEITIGLLLLLL